MRQQLAIYRGSLGVECSPAFWAGHCAVHGYSPVVVLCSVLKGLGKAKCLKKKWLKNELFLV